MTKNDDSVVMSPGEWLGHERALRKWKLVAGIAASVLTVLLAAGAWIRSDAKQEAREEVRKEMVHGRLLTLEKHTRQQSKRLEGIEAGLCRLLWLQHAETPSYCGSP